MQLPDDFIRSTRQLMGDALYATLEAGLNANPLVSIRINPFKLKAGTFDVHGAESPVPWCPNGFYLPERPNFTFLCAGGGIDVYRLCGAQCGSTTRAHA